MIIIVVVIAVMFVCLCGFFSSLLPLFSSDFSFSSPSLLSSLLFFLSSFPPFSISSFSLLFFSRSLPLLKSEKKKEKEKQLKGELTLFFLLLLSLFSLQVKEGKEGGEGRERGKRGRRGKE